MVKPIKIDMRRPPILVYECVGVDDKGPDALHDEKQRFRAYIYSNGGGTFAALPTSFVSATKEGAVQRARDWWDFQIAEEDKKIAAAQALADKRNAVRGGPPRGKLPPSFVRKRLSS